MAGLASSGRHARANFVLAEMRAAGLEPDEVTFATLIHACTEANNCRAAEVRPSSLFIRYDPQQGRPFTPCVLPPQVLSSRC